MEKIICFIRHGQTDINKLSLIQGQQNHQLNDNGREQAKTTGIYLNANDSKWDIIYSSTLDRAYDTAKIIASYINYQKDIIKSSAFLERNFGDAEGTPVCEETFIKLANNQIHGAETDIEIQTRVMNEIMSIIKNTNEQKIMIVAHSHTIKAALTFLDSRRKFSDIIYNCSMNYLSYKDNDFSIIKTNVTP